MGDCGPHPPATVKLNLHRVRDVLAHVRPDLRGVGVRPAGLQGVEQPERQVTDQQERHRLPARLWTSLTQSQSCWIAELHSAIP